MTLETQPSVGGAAHWFRRHEVAAKAMLLLCGGIGALLMKGVTNWARPWLPEWALPAFVLAGGALLILLRFRYPGPQGEPAFSLFLGIVAVILGAAFLFPLLF